MIVPPYGEFVYAGLCKHIPEWERVTKNSISLQAIRGTKIPLKSSPPLCDSSRAGQEEGGPSTGRGDPGPAEAQVHPGGPKGHQSVPEQQTWWILGS